MTEPFARSSPQLFGQPMGSIRSAIASMPSQLVGDDPGKLLTLPQVKVNTPMINNIPRAFFEEF
ncbi:MAG: hypothetical protein ABIQ18_20785 [Umezawaea sp.]